MAKSNEQESHDKNQELATAARMLQKNGTGVVLTGRIKDGKVELDQSTIEEIKTRFPKGDTSFVAVNAPFDPRSETV